MDVFCLSMLSLNKFAQFKVRERIQIRCVRQTRSIKGDIELPVAIHEAHDGQRVCCLSSTLCLTRKHSVLQGKDKERLIKLKFQGCFLGFFFVISLVFY